MIYKLISLTTLLLTIASCGARGTRDLDIVGACHQQCGARDFQIAILEYSADGGYGYACVCRIVKKM